MAKIKVMVLEDNPITAIDLCETLEEMGYEIAAMLHSGEEALSWLKNSQPDLGLVDVNLVGKIDGITVAEAFRSRGLPVVYLTAQQDSETLKRALATHPAAYLTKPYKEVDLLAALLVALDRSGESSLPELPTDNIYQLRDVLFVRIGKRHEKIEICDIQYIEAQRAYAILVCKDRRVTLSVPMNLVAEKIDRPSFVRIHRSYIINLEFVNAFDTQTVYIDEVPLPISAQYRDMFNKALQKL